MADGYISLVTLPNNDTYDIKDAGAARGNGRVFYGTCSTATSTAIKSVSCPSYDALTTGDIMIVKFNNTNSAKASNLKMNVNGTGDKAIKRQYNTTGASDLVAVSEINSAGVLMFVYNGTYWMLTNADYNVNTLLRTYALDLDAERPLLAQTQDSTTWTHYTSSYKDWYGAIPNSASKCATINMSTGKITATGFKGDGSELTNLTLPDYGGNKSIITYPNDGYLFSSAASVSGYIKIKIPVPNDSVMFSFDVDIYNYLEKGAIRYHIGGYNFENTTAWYLPTAYCIAPIDHINSNLTVRFVIIDNQKYITIGETNTEWKYPKIKVHNILGNFVSKLDNWKTGWTVTIENTELTSSLIKKTITNSNIAYNTRIETAAPTSSGTVGYLVFSPTVSTGAKTLKALSSVYVWDSVTTNDNNEKVINLAYLCVGKASEVRGGITIHTGANANYGNLLVNTGLTGARNYTFPDVSGNVAIYEAGTGNASTLDWGTTYVLAKLNNTDIKFTTMALPTYSDVGAAAASHTHDTISNVKIYTGSAKAGKTYVGWVKFASYNLNDSNQFGNQIWDIHLYRSYNSPQSECYNIRASVSWDLANIVLLGGDYINNKQIMNKFRIVRDHTNHKAYFEYYVNTSYTTSENIVSIKVVKWYGQELTIMNEVQSEADTDFAYTYEIDLKKGIAGYGAGLTNLTWDNIDSKPDSATRWPKWNEIADGTGTLLAQGADNVTASTEILTSYASNNGFSDTHAVGKVYRRTASKVVNATLVKAALGTNSTHGNTYLRKDGTWLTPPYPVTSVASLTGAISASDLRTQLELSAALRFVGKVASNSSFTPSDGGTGAPTVTGVTSYTPAIGDVVLDKDSDSEYVCISVSGTTYTWERLGSDSSWALSGHTHGNITNDGKIGSTANLPVITGTNGALTTASTMYISNTKLAINSTTAPTENLYVSGKVKIDLGSSDGVSQKNFLVQGSTRALSIGGAGILAYNSDGSAVAACYIQNAGGDLYIGNTTSAASDNRYCYGLFNFSTANGFTYSGIGAASDNAARYIWFSYNGVAGRPVYDADFKYNPSTNAMTIGKLTVTGGTASSTITGTGGLNITTATDKTFTITAGSTVYIKSGDGSSILFYKGSTALARFDLGSNTLRPETDLGYSLGLSNRRWNNIYGSHIELIHTKDTADMSLEIKYSTTIDFWWGVGTGNANHGMYDEKVSDWIILAGANNTWSFKGTALNATNISATLATTSKAYLLGTTTAVTSTAANVGVVGDTGVYLTTTAGQLSAKSYSVNDGTNEKVRLQWNSTDSALDFIFN